MSRIEKEIGHNIGKGVEYAGMAKKGVEEGLGSLGKVAGGLIPSVSYHNDQEGRLYRVTQPSPLAVMLFRRVPRIEIVTERRWLPNLKL